MPLSIQEAREQVATKYGAKNWDSFCKRFLEPPVGLTKFTDEAAELYMLSHINEIITKPDTTSHLQEIRSFTITNLLRLGVDRIVAENLSNEIAKKADDFIIQTRINVVLVKPVKHLNLDMGHFLDQDQ